MAIKNKEIYKGMYIKQVKGIINVFDSFFQKEIFETILEIGTGNGYFSLYFAEKFKNTNTIFSTFDIKNISKNIKDKLIKLKSNVFTCDINENSDIDDLIENGGRCLILNDGGLKVRQFLRFSKTMKENDMLLSHDYYKDAKSAPGIIVIQDVNDCIIENNLKVIYESMFDNYLWLCVTKRKYL